MGDTPPLVASLPLLR